MYVVKSALSSQSFICTNALLRKECTHTPHLLRKASRTGGCGKQLAST
jgi:hypothetical protein